MLNIRLSLASLLRRIITRRFLKFGTVGASGILVNQGVLYVMEKHVFHVSAVLESGTDWLWLNVSLATAIFFATLNNFIWNRMWTWADRKQHDKPWPLQFGQYILACWLSIALQMLLTNLLAPHFYIYAANLVAIVATSVLNFILNDIWTFGRLKLGKRPPDQQA